MNDEAKNPLIGAAFTTDDVEVIEKVRDHNGYFQIDRYRLRHKKFDGGWTETMSREVFERGHVTAVLLYDPDLDHLVFIEQFRPGAYAAFQSPWFDHATHTPWMVECIAGIIDEGETPETVACRESVEEANCIVTDLEPISHYLASPGGTSESVFLFCGRTDASGAGGVYGLDEEHEDIRVLTVPSNTAIAWLDGGKFDNAMTIIAMQWFKINRQTLRAKWAPDKG